MGLFSKKIVDEPVSENKESIKKEEIIPQKPIEEQITTKQEEFDSLTKKIQMVKEEYNEVIENLMSVKRELNQKKMEHDFIQLECRKLEEKNKKSMLKDSKSISEYEKTEENLFKMKKELDEISEEYDQTKKQVEQAQITLHGIKNQQIEYQEELDEARVRLYNAKEELSRKGNSQDTSVLTPKEMEFIQAKNPSQKGSEGVIEAASIVVGSLKSKLSMTEKELEAIHLLLEKEREEHDKTKQELEKLKSKKSIKS